MSALFASATVKVRQVIAKPAQLPQNGHAEQMCLVAMVALAAVAVHASRSATDINRDRE